MHHAENKNRQASASICSAQTARVVELCADQIKVAVEEASQEIDAVSRSGLDAARHAAELLSIGSGQPLGGAAESTTVNDKNTSLQQAVQKMSVHLQFADRLNQRLANVSKNLTALAGRMQSQDFPESESAWKEFLQQLRGTFTMEQERNMFDTLFAASGTDADEHKIPKRPPEPVIFDSDDGVFSDDR